MNKLRSISAAPRHRPVFDFATPLTRKGGELATADDASVPRFVDLGLTQPVFTVLVELCTSGGRTIRRRSKNFAKKSLLSAKSVYKLPRTLSSMYRVLFFKQLSNSKDQTHVKDNPNSFYSAITFTFLQ